jgi:hypothetical protein
MIVSFKVVGAEITITYPVRKLLVHPGSGGRWDDWNNDEKCVGKKKHANDDLGSTEWGIPIPFAI